MVVVIVRPAHVSGMEASLSSIPCFIHCFAQTLAEPLLQERDSFCGTGWRLGPNYTGHTAKIWGQRANILFGSRDRHNGEIDQRGSEEEEAEREASPFRPFLFPLPTAVFDS